MGRLIKSRIFAPLLSARGVLPFLIAFAFLPAWASFLAVGFLAPLAAFWPLGARGCRESPSMFGRRIIVLSRLAALGQLIQAASNAFQYSHDAGPVETNVFGFSIGVGRMFTMTSSPLN